MSRRCRSCGAEIRWARTEKGKRIPLDDEPTVKGNVTIARQGDHVIASVLGPMEAEIARQEGRTLYLPHHASCPQGDAWKR